MSAISFIPMFKKLINGLLGSRPYTPPNPTQSEPRSDTATAPPEVIANSPDTADKSSESAPSSTPPAAPTAEPIVETSAEPEAAIDTTTDTAPDTSADTKPLMQPAKRSTWDHHTDRRINMLHPFVQQPAYDFINAAETDLGLTLRVTQGRRSIAEQEELYAKGRTAPGKIVTHAKGGESYHNYGQAIDIVEITPEKQANWRSGDEEFWQQIGALGEAHGFAWGGRWKWPDRPHFEMSFGLSTQDLQAGKRPEDVA